MPTAIKLSDEFVDLARSESRLMDRSIAGQVEHWARLGRAMERAEGFDYERIRAVLWAGADFDALAADEQAIALAHLEEHLEDVPRDRDAAFFAKLRAAGVSIHGEREVAPKPAGGRIRKPVPRRRSRSG